MYKLTKKFSKKFSSGKNPYKGLLKTLKIRNNTYQYFSLPDLKDSRVGNKIKRKKIFNLSIFNKRKFTL